jgi:arginase
MGSLTMGMFMAGVVTGARRVTVLGAATSAGTHHAGQERAPDALRAGGFVERLKAAGLTVTDLGNVVCETFRVDAGHGPARNMTATVRAARSVADAVEHAALEGSILLVLGGDCTITLGVLAGLQRVEPDTGLVYFDGDADLGTPGDGSGILDAMGITHLLGLAETELTGLFETRPPLAVRRLAMLGYDETDPESRRSVFDARPDLTHYPDHAVRADPLGCARGALAAVQEASRLIVHFDVDAVDSGDLPLANFPHYGTGVPLVVARQVLSVLFAAPSLTAVVLTEVNPSYDPAGDSLDRYIEAVTGALIPGLDGAGR